MSTVEEEIAALKLITRERVRKLRERERKEQQAVHLRVAVLLQERDPELYESLCDEASEQLDAATRNRSAKAREGRSGRDVAQPEDGITEGPVRTHSEGVGGDESR